MMEELYLPTLHWFAMKNSFSGSCGDFRFLAKPDVVMATPREVDFEASSIKCEFWRGPLCYELSTIEQMKVFPLSEEGKENMRLWLQENI